MTSKEEFLKIQTCVLKVNIHCDGCKQKVKKILQKIDGVFTSSIDAEQGKVTVSGNVDPSVLIKKLSKSGKHAELWSSPKPNSNTNNNHNQFHNQFNNMHIDSSKVIGNINNKSHRDNANNKNNQQHQPQHLQQLQQIKALQDLMPHLKDHKLPPNYPNQTKPVKLPTSRNDDEDFSDDEFDEFDDEFDEDEDMEFDDEMEEPHHPLNKMKPPPPIMGGNNGSNNLMGMHGSIHPHLMNAPNGGAAAAPPNVGGNGKKGGGGGGGPNKDVPVQINMDDGNGGDHSKNGGKINGGNDGDGGLKIGGGKPQDVKISHNGHGAGGGGGQHGNMSQVSNMKLPLGQLGNMPIDQMGNIPAVQGLPAASTTSNVGSASGGGTYFQGAGPDPLPSNPFHQQQQQYLAAMMNQQKTGSGGGERFQPMMYARPPPTVNYMPPPPNPNPNPNPYPYPYPYAYPYPYPYQYQNQHGSDPYTNMFNDESTSSCNVM